MLTPAPLRTPIFEKWLDLIISSSSRWGIWFSDLARAVNNTYGGTVTLALGTATVTLPKTEADALYRIALSCDANETIRWSAKTTTSFILTSSNGASTANVDYVISRG